MSITINIYYRGVNGSAGAFARRMLAEGIVDRIRREAGNERYDYFIPLDDTETLLLIDSWQDQRALDAHHASPLMQQIARLREEYDLHMRVERYTTDVSAAAADGEKYIRK